MISTFCGSNPHLLSNPSSSLPRPGRLGSPADFAGEASGAAEQLANLSGYDFIVLGGGKCTSHAAVDGGWWRLGSSRGGLHQEQFKAVSGDPKKLGRRRGSRNWGELHLWMCVHKSQGTPPNWWPTRHLLGHHWGLVSYATDEGCKISDWSHHMFRSYRSARPPKRLQIR